MQQIRKAIFPGSFDPFTIGHQAIIKKAATIFDDITIAIGQNINKKGLFTMTQRVQIIEEATKEINNVKVDIYTGLTVEYCRKNNIKFIIRGLRSTTDFEFEREIAQTNKALFNELETIFLIAEPEHISVSSSMIREVLKHNGDVSQFMPMTPAIQSILKTIK